MKIARAIAWIICLGAIALIWLRYDALPSSLPVTRWSSLPKSLPIALRVPLINFVTILMLETMARPLLRLANGSREKASLSLLYLLVAGKAVIEAIELCLLPTKFQAIPIILIAGILGTLGAVSWLLHPLFADSRWKKLTFTTIEKIAVGGLIFIYLLLSVVIVI